MSWDSLPPIMPVINNGCQGPWIWYACDDEANGAVLHCATCYAITVTGNWNDADHTFTPVLREGLVV